MFSAKTKRNLFLIESKETWLKIFKPSSYQGFQTFSNDVISAVKHVLDETNFYFT